MLKQKVVLITGAGSGVGRTTALGRLAVSDMALKQPLPEELVKDFYAYIGCVASAILIDDYRAGLQAAGFGSVEIIDSGLDLSVYTKLGDQMCCGQAAEDLPYDTSELSVLLPEVHRSLRRSPEQLGGVGTPVTASPLTTEFW